MTRPVDRRRAGSSRGAGARGRPPPPPSARSVAVDVIRRVTDEGAYSNLTLARTLARAGLSERDAAFATELVYGTLRRLIPIDHQLAPLLERPIDTAPKGARAALRLGAYQLRFLRVPVHAAVSETVGVADPRHRGFVNAVLRRLATLEPEAPEGHSDLALSLRTGLAEWAVRELRRIVSSEETERVAAALAAQAPLTIRTNTCRTTVDELERELRAAGVGTERGTVYPDSLVVASGAPSALPGFTEGRFAVQDQASSFVVAALDPREGDRVLDVCAGPGGKTGHLACAIGPEGRSVAADVSPARLELVRANVERLGARTELLVQDGRRPALRGGFDRVLVDAPCSGIGSSRRRPELLWRARKDELSSLARLQVGVATAAAGLLRPGGRLVYSVCTFPRAETDAACDAILRRAPGLEPVEIAGPDGPAERVRLWPHTHGCDAMFVAAFRGRATPRG
ncbi:MAG TPA: 16S rRNA (cytosine(967)-C(5))-methyltransferase RsmB [Actinomycetota bacterium]|nr:16S rRNA (cytosine(967)-C(5))-methyltransferase RsmB [Actinomycetota bacterium]